ncbi:hypothetical protein Clacol_000875 [Clathrus columnatus]|uniref:Xylanolytic transcriptional activator regulatory domain-containing protein n=1 Tax=Clathrus columnatus TaxID=1419009 RepID=A0AAV5A0Y5_9AGAM|nr:hypothetical protein Clacol_000875 [Clathrus columnatus]
MPPQVPTGKACKECRRLRLGCDRRRFRKLTGTLEKGARQVVRVLDRHPTPRSTIIIELQETIAELRNRNYLLEEALRKLQATISSEPHPLLQERTPSGGASSAGQTPPSAEVTKEDEISDALDNFFIVGDGEISLHGPTASAEGAQATDLRHISPHILSILFMACGLGSLADISNSRRFVEAEEYHTIARAVLCLRPVYEYPTLHAAQAMCLMLLYHMITERRSTGYIMALWSVLGRMCEMLSLNYDQRKLKKDSVELREVVFWEIMHVDSWYSFMAGRDRSIKFNTITCKKPLDPDQTPGGGYETWKHRYTLMLDSAVNKAFREKGSTYALIQQLDSELRNVYCPHSIEWPEDAAQRAAVLNLPPHDNTNAMQRYLAKAARETGILHLHRWFFQQAIHDNTGNPFQHHFGFSVKATLKASSEIIRAKRDIYTFQRVNTITLRFLWLHTYSAAMVLGTFISLFPIMDEAADALSTFDCACGMFSSMEEHRVPSLEALVRFSYTYYLVNFLRNYVDQHVLRNLQTEAHRAMLSKTPSFSTDSLERLGFWTNVPNPYNNSNSPSPPGLTSSST